MQSKQAEVDVKPARVEPAAVGVLALASAVMSALSPAAPTGIPLWDFALVASLALVVVIQASQADQWPVLLLVGLAAASSAVSILSAGVSPWGPVGWGSMIVAAAAVPVPRHARLLTTAAAAIAVPALLRMPAGGFFGLQSLLVGAASALVAVSGYRHASQTERRAVRQVLGGFAGASIAVLVVGGIATLSARGSVTSATDAAQRSLDAARAGDADVASTELQRAEALLADANDRVNGIASRTLRLLPIASQNHQSLASATDIGADIAGQAVQMVNDLDRIGAALEAGSIDVESLERIAPSLGATSSAMTGARQDLRDADSPWLVPLLRDRLSSTAADLDELLPEVELAADAVRVLPAMLGADEPQRYLVFFGTPAEARELGGLFGSWALVEFDDGSIELVDSGRNDELEPIARASSIDAETTLLWYVEMARPSEFPQNLGASPDFRFVAEMARQVVGGVSDQPLSGLIYLDAVALIDLLEITGPVTIPGRDQPLTTANAAQFFFNDQYEIVGNERDELFDGLALVAESVIEKLSSSPLPGPEELGRILGPAARGGHLQVVTFDDEQNEFLQSAKLLRDFGPGDTGDFLAVVHSNGLANKMDLYLERSIRYEAEIDENGTLVGSVFVTLRSTPPDDAPSYAVGQGPDARLNSLFLSVYTPNEVLRVFHNDVEVTFASTSEFDLQRYMVDVTVQPDGEPEELEFIIVGSTPLDHYSLEVWNQPLVNPDQLELSLGGLEWSGELTENLRVSNGG